MNLWTHVINALKGEDSSTGESWSDSQALRLLDKEIRKAGLKLKDLRDTLAELLAKQKLTQERIKTNRKNIEEMEDYARQALDKNEEALAREIVENIMPLEQERESDTQLLADYQMAINDLQQQMRAVDLDLKQLKQQVATIKATTSVQKAQAAVIEKSSSRQSAQDALEKMRARQAEKSARLEAERSLTDDARRSDLLERLRQAGINTNRGQEQAILDRIKNKE
jgi:phage shock protein A